MQAGPLPDPKWYDVIGQGIATPGAMSCVYPAEAESVGLLSQR